MLKKIPFVGNILMVVGGHSDERVTDKTYAMSLDPSVSVPSCLRSTICDYPHYFRAATSAIFQDGLPTICGGVNDNTSPNFTDCYKFNYTDGWTYSGSKNYNSSFAGEDEINATPCIRLDESISCSFNVNHHYSRLLQPSGLGCC